MRKYYHYIHMGEKFYQLRATKQQLLEHLKSLENGSFRNKKNLVFLSMVMIVISYSDEVVS